MVASSGIAAILLKGGKTAHSKIQIPLKALPSTNIQVTKRSLVGKLLIRADIIIWNEAGMIHKDQVDAVDRLFSNLMDHSSLPFGGKPIIFGGDFKFYLS